MASPRWDAYAWSAAMIRSLAWLPRSMHRVLESSREPRFSLAAKAGKLVDKLSNRDVQIGVDCPAVNIPTRQREPCARRKARGDSTMTAQHDLGGERVIGETCDRRKFLACELTQRVGKGQVMSRNVDRQISHGEQQLFEEFGRFAIGEVRLLPLQCKGGVTI